MDNRARAESICASLPEPTRDRAVELVTIQGVVPIQKQRIEYVSLEDIHPYPGNPRRNDQAVQAVANCISEFGFRSPIIVDADGTIIAGHTRYKAAQSLGFAAVPVVVASDLTPEQCAAYRLADNRVGELAEWDMDLLAQELDGLSGFDMEQFGFDEDISSMEFMDFDGLGDGGGSRMQTGDKVRVVIGPAMFDIADPTHELYDACRDMDTERAGRFIERAIRGGEL